MIVARPSRSRNADRSSTDEIFRTMDAVHDALDHELATDPEVFIAGIDVGAGGNVFGLTRGLQAGSRTGSRHPDLGDGRSSAWASGAAMAGMRPVVEIMYLDFIGVCLDQIMNQAAKLPFMTGGRSRWRSSCARSSAPADRRAASTARASKRCSPTSPASRS